MTTTTPTPPAAQLEVSLAGQRLAAHLSVGRLELAVAGPDGQVWLRVRRTWPRRRQLQAR